MSVSLPNTAQMTAIVPARNEEAVIAACANSLAPQAEISEILVINDQSTDSTVPIVSNLARSIPKLRLLETKELPAGWVGKNNAVWLGAREAKHDWLLFTDADAVHEKDSAGRALAIASQENAAMVSFSAEQVMNRWYEKSLIPYVYCRLAHKFSFDDVNDQAKPAAAANGQFLLIRRDVYQAVGGHASVARDVLEDVALAKRVKGAGYRIWFGSGKGIVRVRMYRTFGAMWEGWKKNLYPLMGSSSVAVGKELARALFPIAAVLAIAISVWGITVSAWPWLIVLLIGIIIILVADALELLRNQFPSSIALYAIAGRLLFAGVLWASYRSHRRGKLEWKGREYPVGTPGASK
ncbi:MAG TPA: glycosyltransferase [Candidatus Acidoferrales bacterium]|jgi:cellulose synthase/poly-beta-1,6-N-acetylglucosamine synthase-like glycosyltransferase|nr:glycosyltransferase [Candidatus Acidoferrales bacterium]